jgi:hypothetical protein
VDTSSYRLASLNNGQFQQNGAVISVSRESPQFQGVSILPNTVEPVRLDFSVTGEGARVRAYQQRQWIDLSASPVYSIMLGPGGVQHIQVIPNRGDSATISIARVTPCSQAANICAPLSMSETP